MELRNLGRCGLKVSRLCLGTMTFGESRSFMKGATSSDDDARAVLDAALDAGIDFVDTANVYSEGRSEELLGSFLGARRQRVVLATKCRFAMGLKGGGPNDKGLSRRHVLEACEASLRRLKTDWIDLYQVHMQDGRTPIDETLRALDDLVRSGKVRYAGCSNYTGYRLGEAMGVSSLLGIHRYESLQIQWSLLVRDAERELVLAYDATYLKLPEPRPAPPPHPALGDLEDATEREVHAVWDRLLEVAFPLAESRTAVMVAMIRPLVASAPASSTSSPSPSGTSAPTPSRRPSRSARSSSTTRRPRSA